MAVGVGIARLKRDHELIPNIAPAHFRSRVRELSPIADSYVNKIRHGETRVERRLLTVCALDGAEVRKRDR